MQFYFNENVVGEDLISALLISKSGFDWRRVEIGSVFATGTDDISQLIDLLKKKAAKNGGDAIIDIEVAPESMSATVIKFVE